MGRIISGRELFDAFVGIDRAFRGIAETLEREMARTASGIAAGTDETLKAAQPVGQEPGAGTADATPTPRGSK